MILIRGPYVSGTGGTGLAQGPIDVSQTPGSFTVPTGYSAVLTGGVKLTSTQTLIAQGTGRVRII